MRLFRVIPALVLLLLAGGGGWWAWQHFTAPAPVAAPRAGRAGGPPVPVMAAAATRRDVPVWLDAIGTVQALNTITLRAQVDGQLLEIRFREGQEVKRGDVLALIDPRPYQAALDQALAKRAQDEAQLANARLDLQRYQQLSGIAGASRQQLDTQRATVAQLQALVAADDAAIANARTQLSFATITSPIDGRVGLRLVDQGNLVQASSATGIASVVQLRPIGAVFTLPQQALPQVLAAIGRGPVAVSASPQGGTSPAVGELLTLDNAVDAQTGTIRLKAQFPNDDGRLWPGAFVTARLQADVLRDVLTIPLVAVQRGPDGASAFVISAEGVVQPRPLRLGQLTESLAVVLSGVEAGERVVTSGALRLSPGARVTVQEDAPAGGAPAPRGRGRPLAEAAP